MRGRSFDNIGEALVSLGDTLTSIGYSILPYSFFAYVIFRVFLLMINNNSHKFVKSIWYFAYGIALLFNDARVELIVMLVVFIEAWDHLMDYIDGNQKQIKKFIENNSRQSSAKE